MSPTSTARTQAFDRFVDDAFIAMMHEVPELPTQMGIFEVNGVVCPQDRFTDVGQVAAAQRVRLLERIRRELGGFLLDELNHTGRATAEVLAFFCSYAQERDWIGTEGSAFLDHRHLLRPAVGLQAELPLFLTELHPMRHGQDAEAYVARVAQIPARIQEATSSLIRQRRNGIVAPGFLIDDTIEEVVQFIAASADTNTLFTCFEQKAARLGDMSAHQRNLLTTNVRRCLEANVYPAYVEAMRGLRRQRGAATEAPGVWALPDGDAYYEFLLRGATTTTWTAAQIHELGLVETAEVQRRIGAAFRAMGYPDEPIAQSFARFERASSGPLADTEENRQKLIAEARQLLSDVRRELPKWFDPLPKADAVIEPIPSFAEHSRNQTYHPPAMDGSRPGVFELNVKSLLSTPHPNLPTLVYHETWPGHHLQLCLALENRHLPVLRRAFTFDAYIEGWAKYAEVLPFEQGFEQTATQRVLSLRAELISTVNLVVDTGIHWKRWSREHAIAYFREQTGMSESFATYVVHRSAAVPAQLCSYKIGLMKMRDLKARMERAMGASFDLRVFHDRVLRDGALPLEVLERSFDQPAANLSDA